jgi:citrate lyase subunit beta / citryl-CoA lyase
MTHANHQLVHPRQALFDADEVVTPLPVCDHYAGVEVRMRKSLEMQAGMGPVFDVTLDCEDGAPVGGEVEHAHLVADMLTSKLNRYQRVGARVHPVTHAAFGQDAATLINRAGEALAYVMVPKPNGVADVALACTEIDRLSHTSGLKTPIPIHVLIETHGALREVDAIAAHPRVQSLSFGLMDFVSAHRGAIPASAMTAEGQFQHPLVVRAKLEISAACHAHGKTPSHCVVTEFKDEAAISQAATRAYRELGYLRMWSIHPDQIRNIVDAFAPSVAEVDMAIDIITAAQAAHWAPISHKYGHHNSLHDRASYRYFWQVLERAQRTGGPLPVEVRLAFFPDSVG